MGGISGIVRSTRLRGLPEGCFIFRDAFTFLAINPANEGNGADTSSPGNPLTPICMSYVPAAGRQDAKFTPTQQILPCAHELCSEVAESEGSEPISGTTHGFSLSWFLSLFMILLKALLHST